jgi:ABC-type multidrug transport system fused ATPase/permease subunit
MKDVKSPTTILKNTFWTLRLIFKFNPSLFIGIALLQILSSTTPFFRNKFFSDILDSVVYRPSDGFLDHFIIFSIFLAASSLLSFLHNQFNRILDTRLQGQLRTMFIGKVSTLDYQHLESKNTGNLISKVDEEFGWRMRQTISDVSNVFSNLISLTAVSIILFPRYPQIWFLIFVFQIPQYFIERYWVQKDWKLREENSDKNKLMWDLNYQLRHKNYISELRVNNAVKFLFKKYQDCFSFFTENRIRLRVSQIPSETILIVAGIIINSYCLYNLISDVVSGSLTVGLFTFYFQTIQQTSDFFRGLVYSSVSITENSYHIGNFRKIMSLKNIISSGTKTIKSVRPPLIEFKDVSFHYPESKKYIYRHLNLQIFPGDEIAIVGQNGAGKSTLIKLLCRYYEPTSGQILVNGINLKDVKIDSWYKNLSYLAQEFNNYWNLNLRENVALGNPTNISDTKVRQSLKKADATFVNKYKNGLDTYMSSRYGGEEPSWGQSQKIAIARIFYRNSPIIILDEPTASIDAVSEYKIFNQLYSNIQKKTLIIVSHRFSTVRNAKRIIVIDKGQIIEEGSHEKLIAQKGLYSHSFNLQAKGYN